MSARAARVVRTARTAPNVIGGLGGWIWLLVIIVPIYYIIVTSLRPEADYYSEN